MPLESHERTFLHEDTKFNVAFALKSKEGWEEETKDIKGYLQWRLQENNEQNNDEELTFHFCTDQDRKELFYPEIQEGDHHEYIEAVFNEFFCFEDPTVFDIIGDRNSVDPNVQIKINLERCTGEDCHSKEEIDQFLNST